jgi:Transglycosylase SLT domain
MNRATRGRGDSGVIDGAQRFDAAGGNRSQAILSRAFGGIQKPLEKVRGKAGHVAGDDQIPVGRSGAEGRVDAAQRAPGLDGIGQNRDSEERIALRRPDQSDIAGGLLDQGGGVFQQRSRSGGKQGFVAAHAGAAPPSQNETSSHEMIVASAICPGTQRRLALGNKTVYICFILALVMLAASPMRAADAELHKTVVRVDPRTGKLVRSTVVVRPPTPPTAIAELVTKTSRAHDVDPLLVDSVIRVESNYDPNAVSPKGAQGLMQLMPPTARMLGVNDSFDPAENIEAGVKYLKYLQDLYKDDRLALAAYNAGPAAVDRYKQVPPYPETQKYVEKVGKKYVDARNAAAQKPGAASPAPATARPIPVQPEAVQPEEEKHPPLEQFVDADGRLHLRTSQ